MHSKMFFWNLITAQTEVGEFNQSLEEQVFWQKTDDKNYSMLFKKKPPILLMFGHQFSYGSEAEIQENYYSEKVVQCKNLGVKKFIKCMLIIR